MTDLFHIVVTTLDRSSLALIMTLALATLWLAPAVSSTDKRRRGYLLCVLLIINAATTFADLLIRTAALADVPMHEAWPFVSRVLGQSDYGRLWMVRAGIWCVMVAMGLWTWNTERPHRPAWVLLGATLVTTLLISTTSHAGEDGIWSRPNLVNWLHLVSISLWGGAVLFFATMVLPSLRDSAPELQAAAASRLSALATSALMVVVLSGLYNSLRQMNSIADLWNSDYGHVLLTKLVFVGVMLAIGTINRFYLVPQMRNPSDRNARRLLGILRLDSVIFIAALVSAVVLGMQEPPAHS